MKKILFALLLLPFFQVACKKSTDANPDLTDREWLLIEVYEKDVPDQVQATLFLAPFEPICNGSSGCNAYGADYVLANDALQFKNLVSTEKACQGIMDWESDFFDALLETEQYRIVDGKLELLRNNTVVAVLE
jgi:heat shock protein HslJ